MWLRHRRGPGEACEVRGRRIRALVTRSRRHRTSLEAENPGARRPSVFSARPLMPLLPLHRCQAHTGLRDITEVSPGWRAKVISKELRRLLGKTPGQGCFGLLGQQRPRPHTRGSQVCGEDSARPAGLPPHQLSLSFGCPPLSLQRSEDTEPGLDPWLGNGT